MTFFQNVALVFAGVLLGIVADRVVVFLNTKKTNKEALESSGKIICLFAKELKTAIINNDHNIASESYKHILTYYPVINNDNRLNLIFDKLSSYYNFLKSGGYKSMPDKKEKHLEEIAKILVSFPC